MRVISGFLKGRIIKGFTLNGTRPTMDRVKESVFASIQTTIPNSVCLDLFAGSGALGIEAISNGASKCFFVDNSKDAIKVINENINNFNITEKATILKKDYKEALKELEENNTKFDIIFIDPPYNMHIINDIIEYIDKNNLLNKNGVIICEIDNNYLKSDFQNLYKYKEKRYGSTYVYFYNFKFSK